MKQHPIRDPELVSDVEARTAAHLREHGGTGQVVLVFDFKDWGAGGTCTYRLQVVGPRRRVGPRRGLTTRRG